jgi:hypothetical protein
MALPHVRSHRFHNPLFRKRDLRVQIRQAEVASASAACCHLHDAESGSLTRRQQFFRLPGMIYLNESRESFAPDCLTEQFYRFRRFAPAFDNAIDTQFIKLISFTNLPSAGAADDHLEIGAEGVVFDLEKEIVGVMRIDRLAGRTEDRRVYTSRERHTQRVVCGNGNDPSP